MIKTKIGHLKFIGIIVIMVFAWVNAAQYVSAASQIRITEIMYDPSGDGSKEFVEFYNGSDTSVVLSGWSTFGVDFVFPAGTSLAPGSYIIIARNVAALRTNYPSARIAGQYTGKLKGSGELIKLMNASGQTVSQVSYTFGGAWPIAPRDGGPSLSLIRPTANESSPACWAPSSAQGGSPGVANSIQGGYGGGCGDVAYAVTPPPPAVSPPQATTQTEAKKAEEEKKKLEAQQATDQKSQEEQQQKAIAAAEVKAKQQVQADTAMKRKNSNKRWLIIGMGVSTLAVLGGGSYLARRQLRKKDVQQVLKKRPINTNANKDKTNA